MELIRKLSGRDDFRLVACQVEDWNRDLSPWEAPPVFGKEGFGGKTEKTLQDIRESVTILMTLGTPRTVPNRSTNPKEQGPEISGPCHKS